MIELFFVVYSITTSGCLYWYSSEDPLRFNPCGENEIYVPEKANRIDL